MKRDLDILAEMKALNRRKAQLIKLIQLRGEVAELERATMRATDAKCFLKIIAEEVCARFKLDMDVIMGPSRQQNICVPRQIIFYLGRKLKHIPTTQMGRAFQRDHSTITYACQSVEDRMATDENFTSTISALASACKVRLEKEETA